MVLAWLEEKFTVAKWVEQRPIEDLGQFSFWSKTDEELSLVCPTRNLPVDVKVREDGWRAFCVMGQMEFSLMGILAKLSTCLAEVGISIFAISTFNTDYIFIKADKVALAQDALTKAGWCFSDTIK